MHRQGKVAPHELTHHLKHFANPNACAELSKLASPEIDVAQPIEFSGLLVCQAGQHRADFLPTVIQHYQPPQLLDDTPTGESSRAILPDATICGKEMDQVMLHFGLNIRHYLLANYQQLQQHYFEADGRPKEIFKIATKRFLRECGLTEERIAELWAQPWFCGQWLIALTRHALQYGLYHLPQHALGNDQTYHALILSYADWALPHLLPQRAPIVTEADMGAFNDLPRQIGQVMVQQDCPLAKLFAERSVAITLSGGLPKIQALLMAQAAAVSQFSQVVFEEASLYFRATDAIETRLGYTVAQKWSWTRAAAAAVSAEEAKELEPEAALQSPVKRLQFIARAFWLLRAMSGYAHMDIISAQIDHILNHLHKPALAGVHELEHLISNLTRNWSLILNVLFHLEQTHDAQRMTWANALVAQMMLVKPADLARILRIQRQKILQMRTDLTPGIHILPELEGDGAAQARLRSYAFLCSCLLAAVNQAGHDCRSKQTVFIRLIADTTDDADEKERKIAKLAIRLCEHVPDEQKTQWLYAILLLPCHLHQAEHRRTLDNQKRWLSDLLLGSRSSIIEDVRRLLAGMHPGIVQSATLSPEEMTEFQRTGAVPDRLQHHSPPWLLASELFRELHISCLTYIRMAPTVDSQRAVALLQNCNQALFQFYLHLDVEQIKPVLQQFQMALMVLAWPEGKVPEGRPSSTLRRITQIAIFLSHPMRGIVPLEELPESNSLLIQLNTRLLSAGPPSLDDPVICELLQVGRRDLAADSTDTPSLASWGSSRHSRGMSLASTSLMGSPLASHAALARMRLSGTPRSRRRSALRRTEVGATARKLFAEPTVAETGEAPDSPPAKQVVAVRHVATQVEQPMSIAFQRRKTELAHQVVADTPRMAQAWMAWLAETAVPEILLHQLLVQQWPDELSAENWEAIKSKICSDGVVSVDTDKHFHIAAEQQGSTQAGQSILVQFHLYLQLEAALNAVHARSGQDATLKALLLQHAEQLHQHAAVLAKQLVTQQILSPTEGQLLCATPSCLAALYCELERTGDAEWFLAARVEATENHFRAASIDLLILYRVTQAALAYDVTLRLSDAKDPFNRMAISLMRHPYQKSDQVMMTLHFRLALAVQAQLAKMALPDAQVLVGVAVVAAVRRSALAFTQVVAVREGDQQLGWNCFDFSIGLAQSLEIGETKAIERALMARTQLVELALSKRENAAFRALLAPEIRHAAAITVAQMLRTPSRRFPKGTLPECMHTDELQGIVTRFNAAHEAMRGVVAECSAVIFPDKSTQSLAELDQYFSEHPEHVCRAGFMERRAELFTPHEQAFAEYCQSKETYTAYVQHYYGAVQGEGARRRMNWFAFQRSLAGERSTSMVDIAAQCMGKNIIIIQGDAEIYCTTIEAEDTVTIQYNGSDHFVPNDSAAASVSRPSTPPPAREARVLRTPPPTGAGGDVELTPTKRRREREAESPIDAAV